MRSFRLAMRQIRYEFLAFSRNPASAFFTIAFPLIFLVIFNLLFGNEEMRVEGGTARTSTFYVPAIAAFAVINACYTGLAMTVTYARDQGQLKRVGGTPLPVWAYLAGKVVHLVILALILVAIVIAFGAAFYGVEVPRATLPAFGVSLALGAATFSVLALALTSFVPNADAAPAVVNASILPLLFVSDVFIPLGEDAPRWIAVIGDIFPVKHLSLALQTAFNPFEPGAGWEPVHLLVIALWGLAGAVIAQRFFTWQPRV